MIQRIKQNKINSIRSQNYKRIGLQQIAITDEDRNSMIAAENRKCDQECSKVYEALNLIRTDAGLPALINPYKE